ncbi:AAA family ATPase [Hahella aquimaris]|uniref:AAA family ATPase n=1 Tax=Hahella sp. HNIBRBA332 TaxID=3015983 RepID=UPI00273C9ED3|nr:AAA family ATPase [Hahella sp. HNIBRBA332]WLQ14023.1 AAA family ATPase [Hahella sp. HNIBRBA332]
MQETGVQQEPVFALDAWREVYGVDGDPFDGRRADLLQIGRYGEVIENLRHLIHFSERIVALTAPKGGGKSLLLKRLIELEGEALRIVLLKPGLLEGAEALVIQLATGLELPTVENNLSTKVLLAEIMQSCERSFASGLRTLFIIDDAHELSDESLELLVTRFNPEQSGAFGLLLVGQLQITQQLARACGARGTSVQYVGVPPLDLSDTSRYLNEKLRAAGWSGGEGEIPPAVVGKLYQLSKGIPGRIDRLAGSLLLSAGAEKPKSFSPSTKLYQLVSGFLLAIFIGGVGFIAWRYEAAPRMEGASADSSRVTIKLPAPEPAVEAIATQPEIPVESVAVTPDELSSTDSMKDVQAESATNLAQKTEKETNQKTVAAESAVKMPVAKSDEVVEAKSSDQAPPTSVHKDLTSVAGESESSIQTVVKNTPPKAKTVETVRTNVPTADVVDDLDHYFRTNEWLQSQASSAWTIQLLGSLHKESVQTFLRREGDTQDFYVKSLYQGKDWYVVLRGVYPSIEQAKEALAQLPQPLVEQGAWVRSISGLQGLVK